MAATAPGYGTAPAPAGTYRCGARTCGWSATGSKSPGTTGCARYLVPTAAGPDRRGPALASGDAQPGRLRPPGTGRRRRDPGPGSQLRAPARRGVADAHGRLRPGM